ncbi:MAG: glycosyltransferase family 2 protein [Bryobacteraceae bacterium]|nr:glycosyltransferase family 2 protein [Bryobacteraceae bacterium]
MTAFTVVVVTHNSVEVVDRCLLSCQRLLPAEILVVDNASLDGTAEAARRPGVRVFANRVNTGFAAAVNQGIAAARTPAVLLLNPDTELPPAIDPLLDALANPEVAAAAPALVDHAGRLQLGFSLRRLPEPRTLIFEVLGINRLLPGNPVNARYRCLDLDLTEDQDVEQPAGACLLIRKSAWELVGGFDEEFHPVWFEDVDFCRRLKSAGFRIRYVAGVAVRHRGAHSVGQIIPGYRDICWYASLLRYAAKAHTAGAVRAVAVALLAGLLPRTVAGIVRYRSFGQVTSFVHIARMAVQSLLHGRRGAGMKPGHTGNRTTQYIKSSSGTGT